MKNRFFIYLFILLLFPCTILLAGCNEPPPEDGNGDGGDIPPSTENSIVSPPQFDFYIFR